MVPDIPWDYYVFDRKGWKERSFVKHNHFNLNWLIPARINLGWLYEDDMKTNERNGICWQVYQNLTWKGCSLKHKSSSSSTHRAANSDSGSWILRPRDTAWRRRGGYSRNSFCDKKHQDYEEILRISSYVLATRKRKRDSLSKKNFTVTKWF